MNAIDLLKADHRKVRSLFREFEQAGNGKSSKKKGVGDQILIELEMHSRLEEEMFYPALEERLRGGKREVVMEAEEEHRIVDALVKELKAMEPGDDRYTPRFTVLIENVEHHIKEEEKEMLPDAEKTLGKQSEELGMQMERRKEELKQSLMK